MSNRAFYTILVMLLLGFFVYYIAMLQQRIAKLEALLIEKVRTNEFNIPTVNRPKIGADDAQIEVLVFIDFTCPHCKEVYAQIERLRPEYIDSKKVRFVFFSYPVPSHENSLLFAAVSNYGHAIDKFEPFYHRLFQLQGSLNFNNITSNFIDLVPDTADFRNRIMQANQPAIEEDIQIIKDFQIKGTPAFIIANELHVGLKTDEQMKATLDEALLYDNKNNAINSNP